jgi:hypothetical protein
MLIVNHGQLHLAGIVSLEERCNHCSKTLAAYPLIMGDDAKQTVYHVTCALELATDLMVDLYTFFSPPAPYPQLFVLTAPEAASTRMPHSERVQTEGVTHAVNEYSSDQGSTLGSSVHRQSTSVVSNGGRGRHQEEERAAPGNDPWGTAFQA